MEGQKTSRKLRERRFLHVDISSQIADPRPAVPVRTPTQAPQSSPIPIFPTLLVFSLYSLFLVFAFYCVSSIVETPYMDEIFHVRQTQTYCSYEFMKWDDKITTLPGLYIFSWLFAHIFSIFSTDTLLCSLWFLRSINVIWALACVFLFHSLLRNLHPQLASWHLLLKTIEIATFPVHFFFHFLYYTDTISTFWVMLAYYFLQKQRIFASAMSGAISVFCRQTNIIWVGFVLAEAVIADYEQGKLCDSRLRPLKSELFPTEVSHLQKSVPLFATHVLRHVPELLLQYRSYVAVLLSFVAFVYQNKGIVVGDRSNHIAIVHLPQFLYFCLFSFAFLGCTLLRRDYLERFGQLVTSPRRSHAVALALVFLALLLSVARFTFEHPFLLADNRHFTFYIWKNFFRRWEWFRYSLIPVYMYAFFCLRHIFDSKRSLLWQCIFFICVAFNLIPSPLLEFRYFIIPFLFLQLHESENSQQKTCLNVAGNILVNITVLYIFLGRSFTWPDGSVARFMW